MKNHKRRLLTLIREAKKGDEKSMEELYERFLPLIKNRAKNMGLNYHEDIKSELVVEFLEAVRRFEIKPNCNKRE